MKRLLGIAAFAGLAAAAAAPARPVWTRTYVESGVGGDAGLFGNWVGVSGTQVVASNGEHGAFAFDATTLARQSLGVPVGNWVRGVAVTGNTAFAACDDSVYRFTRSSPLGIWLPSLPTAVSGEGWDAAADGNLAIVSYDVTSSSGNVQVFEKVSGSWGPRLGISHYHDEFGWSVAIDDLPDAALAVPPYTVVSRNGRMIIGSPGANVGSVSAAGVAEIYEQSGSTGSWSEVAELTDPTPTAGDMFGMDVAISGSYAFVADHDPAGGPGQVHVYKRSSAGAWSYSRTLSIAIGRYGYSIAAYGSRLLVGVPGNTASGQAILYTRSGSTWAYETTFSSLLGSDYDFGISVALGNGRAVVGGSQSGGDGRVYIFTE